MSAIGNRIKELRLQRSLTQKELSTLSGVSLSAIVKYERGDRTPNIEMLTKISGVLNVSPIEFLSSNYNSETDMDERDSEVKVMLETSDNPLAIFLMLKNFKCFDDLNISFLSQEDLLIVSQIISSNIVSTIKSFKDRYKKELMDKFQSCLSSSDDNSQSIQKGSTKLDTSNHETSNPFSKIKALKKQIKEMKKNNPELTQDLAEVSEYNQALEQEIEMLEREVQMLEEEKTNLLSNYLKEH
ncbi:MAG: helix-turn-helix domain-containing protein [Bacillota bacterium]|nr:helix-turn-helix domain-containing protein [Bacillota bacterium]